MSTAEMITRTISVQWDDPGIIHGTRWAPEETLDDARENTQAIQELNGGRRALVLPPVFAVSDSVRIRVSPRGRGEGCNRYT